MLLHFLSALSSLGRREEIRVSWQSKEDKSAHGTRVNESKRARLPNPKALVKEERIEGEGSVYVRVHDCVKFEVWAKFLSF